jgi:2-hydroxychromene-2-carboxylate isomerase
MHSDNENANANQDDARAGIDRRNLILAGGALGLAAAGAGTNAAAAADDVKRIQPRAGFALPLPKNWVADHVTDDLHPPINELPPPLTANVDEDNPLEYDLFLSMDSATGYLMLDRLLALSANYNVRMNFRPILPRQVLDSEEGEFPYTYNYNVVEYRRIAKFMDVPFEHPNPQVVVQDVWPPLTRTLNSPIGEENQKNAYYISRMAAAAALQNQSEAFLDSVYRMIWSGKTKDWPSQVVAALDSAGLDGKAMDDAVTSNPKSYDQVLMKNLREQTAIGHEGSAVAAFRQEPFPGQNRFDQLLWTLERSGLTRKTENAVFLAAGHEG